MMDSGSPSVLRWSDPDDRGMTTAPAPALDRSAERSFLARLLLGSPSDPWLLRPSLLALLASTAGLYAWVFWIAIR
jgi:hypothetical protein